VESHGGTLYDLLVSIATQSNLRFKQVNETIHVKKSDQENLIEVEQYEEITISGTVADENGEPLPGATITVLGSTTGTVTDIDGNYSLSVSEDATLVFSYIDMNQKR
jgi:hypothetical protein